MTTPAPLDQTPEERDLAQRLSRLGPRGEPSPQLDARVLAAARSALDAPPPVPTRHSHRWPVALGVAASLVLAVGVAWRLRPLPAGSTAALAPPTHPTAQAHPAPPAPAAALPSTQMPSTSVKDAGTTAESPTPQEAAPRRAAKADAPPAPDMPVIVDAPAPMAVPSSAPPPPPPQSASNDARATAEGATGANQASELDRGASPEAQPEAGDEPLDAMPPATADAPGVRDAWLSRIRALIDSGDVAGGRRSLHAFVERYPDYPLPEDLRALQQ